MINLSDFRLPEITGIRLPEISGIFDITLDDNSRHVVWFNAKEEKWFSTQKKELGVCLKYQEKDIIDIRGINSNFDAFQKWNLITSGFTPIRRDSNGNNIYADVAST